MQQKKSIFLSLTETLRPFTMAVLPFLILSFFLVSSRATDDSGKAEARGSTSKIAQLLDLSSPARKLSLSAKGHGLYGRANLTFDASVRIALKRMNLSIDHLELWTSEHPDSALQYLPYMPTAMQRNVAGTALFIRESNGSIDEKTAWREAVALVHYSSKYGVPLTLATAVAQTESTFNPGAVSPKGAAGVMQVMWRIHNGLLESNGITGVESLADPEKGVAAGCLLLSRYIKAYGSVQSAMNRYYGVYSPDYQNKIARNMQRIAMHNANLP